MTIARTRLPWCTSMHRWSHPAVVAVVVMLILRPSQTDAQVRRLEPPQRLYVNQEQALVRAGPGTQFYATTTLQRGEQIEAHVETADGWLGIRPPVGSHGWIPAHAAYLLPGGRVVEIIEPDTICWIGSEVETPSTLRWHVRLKRGEQLAVLGETHRELPEGGEELWYKVAPPSGEFRWIRRSVCSEEMPEVALAAGQRVTPADRPATVPKNPRARPLAGNGSTRSAHASSENASSLSADPPKNRAASTGHLARASNAHARSTKRSDVVVPAQYEAYEEVEALQPIEQDEVYYEDGVPIEFAESEYSAVVEDPEATHAVLVDPDESVWDGWHAFDFELPRWRYPLLRWLFSSPDEQPVVDPLADDPFSLEMAPDPRPASASVPRLAPSILRSHSQPAATSTSSYRRRTPWRDPRELRRRRLEGRLGDPDTVPDPQVLLDRIRSNLNSLRSDSTTSETDAFVDRGAPLQPASGLTASARQQPHSLTENQWYGIQPSQDSGPNSVPALDAQPAHSLNSREKLEALRIALSEEVAKPSGDWNLAPIRAEIIQIIEHGETPLIRGEARLLLERVEEFENHAGRTALIAAPDLAANVQPTYSSPYAPVKQAGYVTAASGYAMNSATSSPGDQQLQSSAHGTAAASIPGSTPFDATGILMPVFTSSRTQPQYALMTPEGKIVAYVSPLPGMKLDHYLNQAVGIHGLRGYLPQLQAAFIQAERVVRLR